jgi:hypothetical protein
MGSLREQTNPIAKGDWPMSLIRLGYQSLSLILMNGLLQRPMVFLFIFDASIIVTPWALFEGS